MQLNVPQYATLLFISPGSEKILGKSRPKFSFGPPSQASLSKQISNSLLCNIQVRTISFYGTQLEILTDISQINIFMIKKKICEDFQDHVCQKRRKCTNHNDFSLSIFQILHELAEPIFCENKTFAILTVIVSDPLTHHGSSA